jgi:hypothetical protein
VVKISFITMDSYHNILWTPPQGFWDCLADLDWSWYDNIRMLGEVWYWVGNILYIFIYLYLNLCLIHIIYIFHATKYTFDNTVY